MNHELTNNTMKGTYSFVVECRRQREKNAVYNLQVYFGCICLKTLPQSFVQIKVSALRGGGAISIVKRDLN